MKKRVLIAVALVVALVLIAQTGAWAGKLYAGSEAPAASSSNAGARPAGTDEESDGPTNPPAPYVPPSGPAAPAGPDTPDSFVDYDGDIPQGTTVNPPEGASFYEVTCGSGDTLANDCEVEVSDGATGAWYWDGTEWIVLEIEDGKVTIPDGAPNPFILAVS